MRDDTKNPDGHQHIQYGAFLVCKLGTVFVAASYDSPWEARVKAEKYLDRSTSREYYGFDGKPEFVTRQRTVTYTDWEEDQYGFLPDFQDNPDRKLKVRHDA